MAFSTKNAKRQVMSSDVRDWCSVGAPEETRTLLLKLSSRADVTKLELDLMSLDVQIVSSGPGVTVISTSRANTPKVSHIPGVVRVEMPAHFEPSALHKDDVSTDP